MPGVMGLSTAICPAGRGLDVGVTIRRSRLAVTHSWGAAKAGVALLLAER